MPEPVGDVPSGPLDMRADPSLLVAGAVRKSENFRVSDAGRQVRGGIALQLPPGTTVSNVRFVSIYRPDDENDRIAFICAESLVLFDPVDQSVTTYAYPVGEDVDAADPVDFIQGGVGSGTTPTAYILRGLVKTALEFDGSTVAVEANFRKSKFGIYVQDRMAVASADQEVSTSDFLDFETWALLAQFQVLKGGDDKLMGFLAYQKDYVVLGCRKKFMIAYFVPQVGVAGYEGGLNVRDSWLRDLTKQAGLTGRRAFIEANGALWALSDGAIFSFVPRLDQELTVLGDPVSGPIEPIMKNLASGYASGADFKQLGGRIYCAMPISDDAVKVASVAVSGGVATVTTETAHGLEAGETAQLTGALIALLNGVKTVASVDGLSFTFSTAASDGVNAGTRVRMQRLATRNNVIAVFNTHINGWESIDRLPRGLYADYLLVADDAAGKRRLWMIDREVGPCLYEEGDFDETGTAVGGLRLQFRLQARLSQANYQAVSIAGKLISRTLRWGGFVRRVNSGHVRLALVDGDGGNVTVRVKSPDRAEWTGSRSFAYVDRADVGARKQCGMRGLEAEVEVTTTRGRPVVRTLEVETVTNGTVAES